MTWNGEGLMQGWSAKQLASYSGGASKLHPSCLGTYNTWEMFNWHNQPVCNPPPPPICGGTAQSHGWGASHTYIIFLTRHIRSFAEIKIRMVKRNICEANKKWNTELPGVASVEFRRDKNSGEGWGGGEWKAPNPEADEKQESVGWEGQRRSRPGPRDNFKVTCRRASLLSFPTAWPLQQIPCHILSTSLLHRFLPINHSLQQFACQGFQFPFPFCLLLLSLLMCGLGQYSCIFPSQFLPFLVASSHKGCPGMLSLLHDPSRFRCVCLTGNTIRKKYEKQFYAKLS